MEDRGVRTSRRPRSTGASAVFAWDADLAAQFTLADRFGASYQLWRREGGELHLPVGSAPVARGAGDVRDPGWACRFQNRFKPRSAEQARVVREALALLKSGRSHILQAPTGFGKTVVGCALIGAIGRRAMVLTTKEDILAQWVESVRMVLGLRREEVGLWRAGRTPGRESVVIGLVQSVMKGPGRYGPEPYAGYGLVIVDEVHRMGADCFSEAMWHFPARLRLGLSASARAGRPDGRDAVFHSHIGPIMVEAGTGALPFRVIPYATRWRVPLTQWGSRVHHEVGRTMHLCASLAADRERCQIVADFVCAARERGRRTVVFADTIEHLRALHAACREEGLSDADVGYYLGDANYRGRPAERRAERERAKKAHVIFATYSMMGEGTDLPVLDTCVLASPRANVMQIVGRIRREYAGKREPLVLDLVDVDSEVFAAYARKRAQWYRSVGAKLDYFDERGS